MRLIFLRPKQAGDTIVEVMFAIVVFSMLAVGSISVMNSGTATAERSLEITLVQAQINAQANALRYLHTAYVAGYPYADCTASAVCTTWQTMVGKNAESSASPYGENGATLCPNPIVGTQYKPFALNAQTATLLSGTPTSMSSPTANVPTYAKVVYGAGGAATAYGIWIEAVPASTTQSTSYVDFHIRACWQSPGDGPASTLGTIVRLYEPLS